MKKWYMVEVEESAMENADAIAKALSMNRNAVIGRALQLLTLDGFQEKKALYSGVEASFKAP